MTSESRANAEAIAHAVVQTVRSLPEDADAVHLLTIFVEEWLARPEESR